MTAIQIARRTADTNGWTVYDTAVGHVIFTDIATADRLYVTFGRSTGQIMDVYTEERTVVGAHHTGKLDTLLEILRHR